MSGERRYFEVRSCSLQRNVGEKMLVGYERRFVDRCMLECKFYEKLQRIVDSEKL